MEWHSSNQNINFTLYQIIHKFLHLVKWLSSNKDFTEDFLSYAEYAKQYFKPVLFNSKQIANVKNKDQLFNLEVHFWRNSVQFFLEPTVAPNPIYTYINILHNFFTIYIGTEHTQN